MAKQPPMIKIIVTAVITVFLDIALVYLGTLKQFHLGWAIGSAGIVTFFGMMILNAFLESGTDIFNKNCIRKSIAAGFLCMYFVFVALLSFEDTQITDVIIIQPMISHFTYLVGLVVVFYFASSSVSEYLKLKDQAKQDKDQPVQGKTDIGAQT